MPIVSDKEIIAIITKHQGENLTIRRMCELIGYSSTSTMHARLKKLERNGVIRTVKKTEIQVLRELR
jgi:uncharacterized membrane protein